MKKIWVSLFFVLAFGGSAHAQGNQCRTAPVGASTPNCASEAFVTESIGSIPSGVGSLNGQTGAVTLLTQAQGRLTLQPNTPVMTFSQSAKTTLRYDCYLGGGQVPYYTGSADALDTISSCEVTDAMVSAASAGQIVLGQVYDVWWVHSGANRICLAMSSSTGGGGGWAFDTGGSNTARGTGYSQLDRVTRPYTTNKNALANCFNGSTNYGSVSANQATYLGTVYASANGQISYTFGGSASGGSAALFGVWNMYNRVNISTDVMDSGTSYTYSSSTTRQARASTGNQVSFVVGLQENGLTASYSERCDSAAVTFARATFGLGLDSTAAFAGQPSQVIAGSAVSAVLAGTASKTFFPGVGLHFVAALEASDGANANVFDSSSTADLSVMLWN